MTFTLIKPHVRHGSSSEPAPQINHVFPDEYLEPLRIAALQSGRSLTPWEELQMRGLVFPDRERPPHETGLFARSAVSH